MLTNFIHVHCRLLASTVHVLVVSGYVLARGSVFLANLFLEDLQEVIEIFFQRVLNRVTMNTMVCLAILPQIQVLAEMFNPTGHFLLPCVHIRKWDKVNSPFVCHCVCQLYGDYWAVTANQAILGFYIVACSSFQNLAFHGGF